MIRRAISVAALLGVSLVGCASNGIGAGAAPSRGAAPVLPAPSSTSPGERAGANPGEQVQVTDNELESMVAAALADAAGRARPNSSAPSLVSAEAVTWSDGSLGCPVPGRMYTMALVPGYRIRIRSGGEDLDYHAGKRGKPMLCPAGRAKEPAPNSSV